MGSQISKAGFKEAEGLAVDDGVWKADARDGDGDDRWVAALVRARVFRF